MMGRSQMITKLRLPCARYDHFRTSQNTASNSQSNHTFLTSEFFCISFGFCLMITDHICCECSFEFGPDVYETFRADQLAFFEQLEAMEPGEQRRSLRMIRSFIDLQEDAGGKIDFKGCVRIAFNRMIQGEMFNVQCQAH